MDIGILSISAIIFFREGLEAILIISIILAVLSKINKRDYDKYVYLGAVGAIVASITLGLILIILAISLEGPVEYFYEGFTSIFAAAVLTYMIVWMARNVHRFREDLVGRVEELISSGYLLGLTFLAFVTVFREGLETVLFISVLASVSLDSTFLGVMIGLVILLFVGGTIFRFGKKLPIKKFFKISSIVLIVFAAGLLGYGVHEILEGFEAIGFDLGILSYKVWDISFIISEESILGELLKGIIGYDANPELMRVVVYVAYWIFLIYYLKSRKVI